MMTEEQASECWCPMVRAAGYISRCIASRCAMWRWLPLEADEAFLAAVKQAATELGDTSPSRTKATKHVVENRAQYGLPTKPFRGFCGLAGRPVA